MCALIVKSICRERPDVDVGVSVHNAVREQWAGHDIVAEPIRMEGHPNYHSQ